MALKNFLWMERPASFENNENNGLFKKLRDFKNLKNEIYEKKVLAKKILLNFLCLGTF